MRILLSAVFLSFLLVVSGPVVAAEKVGVIPMHGKWGSGKPKSPIGVLGKALSAEGFIVVTPDMPWSKSRLFAKDFKESMAEIDVAVERLKSRGATKIVGGGHSLGANAALGYGARRDGLHKREGKSYAFDKAPAHAKNGYIVSLMPGLERI